MTTSKKPAARKPAPRTATKTATKAAPKKQSVASKVIKAILTEPTPDYTKPYKMLTGNDDSAFCDKVSAHLKAGYVLHGEPKMVLNGSGTITVGQAVVRPATKAKKKK